MYFVAHYLQSCEVLFYSNFTEHLIKLDSNEYLIIRTIYRSPSSNNFTSTSYLCDLMKLVYDTKPAYVLIAGDFNYLGINWNGDYLYANSSCEQLFGDGIYQYS